MSLTSGKGSLPGGGLLASAVKAAAEGVYPPRSAAQTPPPIMLLRKISSRPMNDRTKENAMKAVHFAFGTTMGAVYGAIAEFEPWVTAGRGSAFGLSVDVLAHEMALPLLGLSAPPLKQSVREQSSEAITHAIYGVITEATRSRVRRKIA